MDILNVRRLFAIGSKAVESYLNSTETDAGLETEGMHGVHTLVEISFRCEQRMAHCCAPCLWNILQQSISFMLLFDLLFRHIMF